MSTSTTKSGPGRPAQTPPSGLALKLVGAWTFVGVPLAYGIVQTVKRAADLFGG